MEKINVVQNEDNDEEPFQMDEYVQQTPKYLTQTQMGKKLRHEFKDKEKR